MKIIQFEGIEAYIYRKLKSKKYRKTSIDEESEQKVKEAISLNIKHNKPIKFTYPFGGYKLWRIPSHPNVDWAEFFTIAYLTEYVAQILPLYNPGVEFIFSSDDICIEKIDNYPRSELESYNRSFNQLLSRFRKYFPKNITISLKQIVPDVYSQDEYDKELKKAYETRKKDGLTEDQKKSMIQKMELHFRNKGKQDYGDPTEDEKLKLWEDLNYWSDAYLKLTKRREFVRADDAIVLFSNKIPNAIDIGSTIASKSKFWTGIGVLEYVNDCYTEKILSPKQWENNKSKAKVVDIIAKELDVSPTIPVFKERLQFLTNSQK